MPQTHQEAWGSFINNTAQASFMANHLPVAVMRGMKKLSNKELNAAIGTVTTPNKNKKSEVADKQEGGEKQ
eukprot:15364617-Ditylum_brightwellii.AAC.1